MTASGTQHGTPQQERAVGTASYVYAIVPAGDAPAPDEPGVGDPPGRVTLLPHRGIAALVSEIDVSRPLGRPEDLVAHQRVVDEASEAGPVLPLCFGAVVTGPDAVIAELLEPYHDEFAESLDEIAGTVQYVLTGRYDGPVVLAEILAESPEAARLREEISGQDETVTRPARIRLGEIIGGAIAARREADSEDAARVLEPLAAAIAPRDPAHEFDAVHFAVLADEDRQAEIEDAFRQLSSGWAARVELRLLGPMAPYDFVSSPGLSG